MQSKGRTARTTASRTVVYEYSEDRRTQSVHYMGNNPGIILKIKVF